MDFHEFKTVNSFHSLHLHRWKVCGGGCSLPEVQDEFRAPQHQLSDHVMIASLIASRNESNHFSTHFIM